MMAPTVQYYPGILTHNFTRLKRRVSDYLYRLRRRPAYRERGVG